MPWTMTTTNCEKDSTTKIFGNSDLKFSEIITGDKIYWVRTTYFCKSQM